LPHLLERYMRLPYREMENEAAATAAGGGAVLSDSNIHDNSARPTENPAHITPPTLQDMLCDIKDHYNKTHPEEWSSARFADDLNAHIAAHDSASLPAHRVSAAMVSYWLCERAAPDAVQQKAIIEVAKFAQQFHDRYATYLADASRVVAGRVAEIMARADARRGFTPSSADWHGRVDGNGHSSPENGRVK
jgi:hypothetical protein